MSRVLFLVNSLERGVYTCQARVSFASAQAWRDFLAQNPMQERDGWHIVMTRGPSRGYDGKPLYQVDVRLSTSLPFLKPAIPLPSLETADFAVNDNASETTYGTPGSEERPQERGKESLTWQERAALQQASKVLLVQLGITDLGRWR